VPDLREEGDLGFIGKELLPCCAVLLADNNAYQITVPLDRVSAHNPGYRYISDTNGYIMVQEFQERNLYLRRGHLDAEIARRDKERLALE
jgi:hypothetical protein